MPGSTLSTGATPEASSSCTRRTRESTILRTAFATPAWTESVLERELAAPPAGPVAVRDRIIQGAVVVERETRGGASTLVIYEVRGGRIVNVWMLR